MPTHPTSDELGEPDIRVVGFQIWIHGWQFPEATEYYDANWLIVTAHCGAAGASVWSRGAILLSADLERFGREAAALVAGTADKARLAPLEPGLAIQIRSLDSIGHFTMRVEITPNHLTQKHSFDLEIDQTHVRELARQCRAILSRYPVRVREA